MTTTESGRLYYRIGDVAQLVGVKPYVLRYWESEFPMISPQKSRSGQRVYRRVDVDTILMIKHLLYEERFSVEGARRRIRELRKSGELSSFRQEAASVDVEAEADIMATSVDEAAVEEATPSTFAGSIEPTRTRLAELRELARAPLSRLFKY